MHKAATIHNKHEIILGPENLVTLSTDRYLVNRLLNSVMYCICYFFFRTPLIAAATKGKTSVLELLIRFNANLDKKSFITECESCTPTPEEIMNPDILDWGST